MQHLLTLISILHSNMYKSSCYQSSEKASRLVWHKLYLYSATDNFSLWGKKKINGIIYQMQLSSVVEQFLKYLKNKQKCMHAKNFREEPGKIT